MERRDRRPRLRALGRDPARRDARRRRAGRSPACRGLPGPGGLQVSPGNLSPPGDPSWRTKYASSPDWIRYVPASGTFPPGSPCRREFARPVASSPDLAYALSLSSPTRSHAASTRPSFRDSPRRARTGLGHRSREPSSRRGPPEDRARHAHGYPRTRDSSVPKSWVDHRPGGAGRADEVRTVDGLSRWGAGVEPSTATSSCNSMGSTAACSWASRSSCPQAPSPTSTSLPTGRRHGSASLRNSSPSRHSLRPPTRSSSGRPCRSISHSATRRASLVAAQASIQEDSELHGIDPA